MFKHLFSIRMWVLTCSLLMATVVVSAQNSEYSEQAPSKISLSLQQAQDFAVEHNRTLKNATLDVQKAEASRWQALSSMLPQVSAGVDYSNYFGYQMNLGQMSISMPPFASLGITSSVALSGAQFVGAQIAGISMKMSDITLKKSEQQIKDQVKVLYYSALVSEETVRLLEENLASLNKLYEISQRSVDVGVSEQTAADQLMVQVATMQTTISSTKRALEMVYNSLRLQLNINANTEIELTQGLGDLMNIEKAISLISEEFVVDNNYDYQLLKKSTDLSKKQIALAGWSYGPTFSIYHQYTAKKYFSNEVTMNMTPPNMMGISVKLPIFSSGKNYNAVREAKLAYKKQINTLEDTEDALNVQHRQLLYNLSSALERYDTQKKNVDVAKRVFDNIAKKYEYGVASSLDVTTSGTSLISAQSSYVQSILEIINAQISLEQLLNK
ncbi:MAG: TolC family protein [Bacteroidales bacterium]|nr:TolC family protein [Bacteroidales bacterium]MDD4670057.1 TolC family protein [Bacteroidales bacterium]